jgi:hypothetical protein
VSAQPKLQPDDFERLKKILKDAPRGYGFLAEYVGGLEHNQNEEDVFLRLAFQNASAGGAYRGSDRLIVSVVSELYEPLDAARKLEIRQWWHEKVRSEANQFDELRTRLSSLR